jgi:hypothetical protein
VTRADDYAGPGERKPKHGPDGRRRPYAKPAEQAHAVRDPRTDVRQGPEYEHQDQR